MIIVVIDLFDYHSTFVLCSDLHGCVIIYFQVYTSGTPPGPGGTSTSIKTCSSTNPEKRQDSKFQMKQGFDDDNNDLFRKWSEVTSSSDEAPSNPHPHGNKHTFLTNLVFHFKCVSIFRPRTSFCLCL